MNPTDIKVLVGTTEGFTSSLNLQFPNGLRLSTPNMLFMHRYAKLELMEQFTKVCTDMGLAPEEIAKIKL